MGTLRLIYEENPSKGYQKFLELKKEFDDGVLTSGQIPSKDEFDEFFQKIEGFVDDIQYREEMTSVKIHCKPSIIMYEISFKEHPFATKEKLFEKIMRSSDKESKYITIHESNIGKMDAETTKSLDTLLADYPKK